MKQGHYGPAFVFAIPKSVILLVSHPSKLKPKLTTSINRFLSEQILTSFRFLKDQICVTTFISEIMATS